MLSGGDQYREDERSLKYEYALMIRDIENGTYSSYNGQYHQKPMLFNKQNQREEALYTLETIFRTRKQETYIQLALECGLIVEASSYRTAKNGVNGTKVHIKNMLKTFNKRSVPSWREKLISTGRSRLETVQLVPAF